MVLLILALMSAAYFTGALVAAGQQSPGSMAGPNLTAAQWAAIHGANTLLFGEPSSALYLPLIDS